MEDVIRLLGNAWSLNNFMMEDNYHMTFYEWIHWDFGTFLLSKLVRK